MARISREEQASSIRVTNLKSRIYQAAEQLQMTDEELLDSLVSAASAITHRIRRAAVRETETPSKTNKTVVL